MDLAHATAEHGALLDECVPLLVPARRARSTDAACLGWFTSLSKLFLSARTARLLVLAGTERLDRELMIGQMQGKFQLSVITGVGHMLQEVRLSQCTCVGCALTMSGIAGRPEETGGGPRGVLEEERASRSWR